MYVHAQKMQLYKEDTAMIKQQYNTDVACQFLPLYLQDEVAQQGGQELQDNMIEFAPAMLYTEQIMRLFPRETAVRMKIYPAFEETFMRWKEARDQEHDQE